MAHTTPNPSTTYTIHQLAKLTRISPSTIRSWIKTGLLPAVPFRGRRTVYGQEHVRRITAIRRLRAELLSMDQIRDRLASATPEEFERIIQPVDSAALRRLPPEPSYPAVRWERVVLHPGLELLVRDEPALRRLAQEIYTYFGPAKT
jgi:excisionase family DNA binding protein